MSGTAQPATAAAPPSPRLEVKGLGGTKVHASRSTSASGKSWWWLGIYFRDICMASCVWESGAPLRFNDEDGQHEVVVDATFVRLPKTSWLQLKSWAEALSADSARGAA